MGAKTVAFAHQRGRLFLQPLDVHFEVNEQAAEQGARVVEERPN